MGTDTADNERYHYLVRPLQADVRAQLISAMEGDPSVHIVRRLGPHDEPHTFVMSMSVRQAEALKQRFTSGLIIERDRPLTAFPEG